MKKLRKLMQRKLSLTTTVLAVVCGMLISGGGVYWWQHRQVQEAQTTSRALSKIQSVYTAIRQNYYKGESSSKLTTGAINGMINALGDQFSEYMSKSEAQSLTDTVSGSFSGIGAEVRKNGNQIQVIAAIANTPAAKAGLKANDVILKLNNRSLTGMSLAKAVSLIRGKIGTKVTLTIKRGNQTFTKTLKRAKIPVATVNSKMLAHHVGYIQITTFSTNTAKEFKQAVKKLTKQKATRLVVDVRNNPGGLMDAALKISSMFLKNGKTIMQTQVRSLTPTKYKASSSLDGGFKVKLKTVVLMNGSSASAAEIFAAALHQSANVKLVGTKSYGKGTVQTTSSFSDGTELKLTIAKWLTPNGTWIHHKGLQPDVKVDYPSYAYQTAITTKTLKPGQVSQQVKKLQIFLKALGYKPGTTNGYYSAQTKAAVKAFQKNNHLKQTGTATQATITKLETKVADKIAQNDPMLQRAVKTVRAQ